MPMRRLAQLREEILVIEHERDRVAEELAMAVGALDTARAEMITAFSALRRAMRVGDGMYLQLRRDNARHLRDAYEVRKRRWRAVVERERELRAQLTSLDEGKAERLRAHRRIYQSLIADAPGVNPHASSCPKPPESA